MNKSLLAFTLLMLFRCCAATASLADNTLESAKRPTNPRDIYNWLLAKQGPHGILGNQENEEFSGVYTSALAAICYTHEGDLDCYAALIDYTQERQRLRDFLIEEMWIPAEGRFKMGSTANESSLDGCSFGVGALGADFAAALQYAEAAMLRQKVCDATGNLVTGFSDFISQDRIWLEGTGQMAVAYRVTQQDSTALLYLGELSKATFASTLFPGTKGLACHTNDPAWPTGSTIIFVPSQAWFIFGAWDFNPMDYDYAQAADFNADGRIDFEDYAKLAQYWCQDEASCPIAPLPVPDGQVNAKDLAALAKYWLTDNTP